MWKIVCVEQDLFEEASRFLDVGTVPISEGLSGTRASDVPPHLLTLYGLVGDSSSSSMRCSSSDYAYAGIRGNLIWLKKRITRNPSGSIHYRTRRRTRY